MRKSTLIVALSLCTSVVATAEAEQPLQRITKPAAEPVPAQVKTEVTPAAEPSGSQATYRVIVERDHQETGVAISKDGWMVASGKAFNDCPQDGSPCTVRVGDSTGKIWLVATLIARDAAGAIALIRVNGEFPKAATLEARSPTPGEPLHVLSYDGRTQSFFAGKFVGVKTVSLSDKPPKTVAALVTDVDCSRCSAGAPMFSSTDDKLLGLYLGTIDGDETGNGAFLPAATIQAFVNAHKGDKPKTAH